MRNLSKQLITISGISTTFYGLYHVSTYFNSKANDSKRSPTNKQGKTMYKKSYVCYQNIIPKDNLLFLSYQEQFVLLKLQRIQCMQKQIWIPPNNIQGFDNLPIYIAQHIVLQFSKNKNHDKHSYKFYMYNFHEFFNYILQYLSDIIKYSRLLFYLTSNYMTIFYVLYKTHILQTVQFSNFTYSITSTPITQNLLFLILDFKSILP
eukprot:TRINITY_DN4792_c0_g1_i4.p1 TRINITY_DN4792_c0_g1~~TRINITY_DN4792_c0_g1_i4.p1  ORF type:complete len:206 (+),score=-23.62 TRINITY_DN4792_c0_g1_i4:457-1074(+)